MMAPIAKRGSNLAGLLRYLFGPGRREEHAEPRLVAVWSGAGDLAALQPPLVDGRRDFGRLVTVLEAPLLALEGKPPLRPVWHCALRTAPGDPELPDATWARIATEFMADVGLARSGDDAAVHWVAVQHGREHIHIAAVLVREDGRIEPARNDYYKARAAAIRIEQRYGLIATSPVDRTSARTPSKGEQRKSARLGRSEAPSGQLLRHVRAAAAGAGDEAGFFRALERAGVQVRLRHSTIDPAQVTGYAVALPGNRTAAGGPVWYGGGRLAADLTLPKLRRRWSSGEAPPQRPGDVHVDPYRLAAEAVRDAAHHLRSSGLRFPESGGAVAQAAADLLTATAMHLEGQAGGPATTAARLLDRAAREQHGHVPVRPSTQVRTVRAMGRRMALLGRLADDRNLVLALQIIQELAELAENLAVMREAQLRLHQAAAARLAAEQLRALAATAPGSGSGMQPPAFTMPRTSTPAPSVAYDVPAQARSRGAHR